MLTQHNGSRISMRLLMLLAMFSMKLACAQNHGRIEIPKSSTRPSQSTQQLQQEEKLQNSERVAYTNIILNIH